MPKTLVILLLAALVLTVAAPTVSAQKLDPDDRIGGEVDMCEGLRFERISGLLAAGKLTEKQAYERWKRIASDTVATRALLDAAAEAGELTSEQVDKLMPILAMKFVAQPLPRRPHLGKFGVNKALPSGTFKDNEITQENRDRVFKRLVAANKRGVIHDYDVSSIMLALYTGWDWRKHTAEQEYIYNLATKPRIMQAEERGLIRKEGMLARYAQKRNAAGRRAGKRGGYGQTTLKIEDPAAWNKALGKQIFSGPQPGEKLPPFKAVRLSGEDEGQEFDAIALAGGELHLLIFASKARTFGRFLPELARQLDTIERNSKRQWEMSFIVVNDDPNDVEKKFEALKRRFPPSVKTGLSTDGSDGPPAYGLDRTLTATVIVAKDGKVIHNLPYASDAFYSQPHILGAVAGAMGVDHAALRKLIGDAPGDQISAVARGRERRGDGARGTGRDTTTAPINGKCPVTGKVVNGNSPTTKFRGRTVALCCDNCKTKFEADPDKYVAALRRR